MNTKQSPMFPTNPLVLSSAIVGRDHELQMLEGALEASRLSTGQAVFISGEAGIGKSRLLAETRRRGLQSGFHVLQGYSFEHDISFPFAPLIDALRAFFAQQPPNTLPEKLVALLPELVKLLPELMLTLPDLKPTPGLDAEAEKHRLFESLGRFLTGLANSASPLLFLLEDLHWADETSLTFLNFFSRRLTISPVLLLASYRPEDSPPQLKILLANLHRERLAAEVHLHPLALPEVETMLAGIFDLNRPVGTGFLERIYALTEGNPFFIEEILKSLFTSGEIFHTPRGWERKPVAGLHIPETVQAAVQRRVERLNPDARSLLQLAAVAGRRFDFALLLHLTGKSEEVLVPLIKELIAAQLVVEESAERFAFRHALTRQAVYAGMLARERRSLHSVIARTLLDLYPGEARSSDLSYHSYEAEEWENTLSYAQQAGIQAQQFYSPFAALEHFNRAVQAANHLGVSPPPEVLRALGQVHDTLGNLDFARGFHVQALTRAREIGDRRAEWQSLFDLGYLWTGHDYEQAGDYLHQALSLARRLEDEKAIAQSLNRMGNWLLNMEKPLEARRFHEEALTLFESLGDLQGLAATYDLLGLLYFFLGDVAAGKRAYEKAIELFRETEDRQGLALVLGPYSLSGGGYYSDVAACPPISLEESLRPVEEALEIARQIGWRAGEVSALVFIGLGMGPRGQFGRSLRAVERALEIAIDINHHNWLTTASQILGAIYFDLMAFDEAEQHLNKALEIAASLRSGDYLQTVGAVLASLQVFQGHLEVAEATLAKVSDASTPLQTQTQRQVWCARAELALARGQAQEALALVERIIRSAEEALTLPENDPPPNQGVIPRLWHMRGRALAALGRREDAIEVFREAELAAQRQGTHPIRERILADLARTCFEAGEIAQGSTALEESRAIIEELAFTVDDPILRDSYIRQAKSALPAPPSLTPLQQAKREAGGLTAREREIATLVARGLSNRDIAETLFLSPRTVGAHVGNILNKLGFSSRAQIAAWVIEKGL